MAYSTFTLETIQQELGLFIRQRPLFETLSPIEPTAWLTETLKRGKSLALLSEKSRSEFIVAPILLTCRELCHDSIYLYSGVTLDVDSQLGLTGECDFIIAQTEPTPALQAPLIVVLEAKKNDIEGGLAQCVAQIYAARQFNQTHQRPTDTLFGCVTTGEAWQFLQLTDQTIYVDTERYYIVDLARLLGVLLMIVCQNELEKNNE